MVKGPFDYVTSINKTKKNLMRSEEDKEKYVPFIINRALSRHIDTIMFANEMNKFNNLNVEMQYDYLLNNISVGNRYKPWISTKKNDIDLDNIVEYYNVSYSKAKDIYNILSKSEIAKLRKYFEKVKGGIVNE